MTMWVPQLSGRSGPRYVAIAEALAEDVRGGRLQPGDRLPTHRALAYRLGVTVGTVTRAYAEAERRGLVRGEVGRGTYVLGPPAAAPWQAARGRTEAAPPAPIDLSTNIAWPGDAEAALARTLARLAEGDLAGLLGYQPVGALPAHRAAAAAWIARERGMPVAPEQVLVTGGGQQAMAVALTALARPGDLILTEQLTYPGMRVLANRLHLRLQGVAMDEDGLVPEAFATACRAGAPRVLYCMPSVQNPTGALMPEARRRAIAEIALDHDVAIVEDDVYGFLAPDGPAPLSVHAPPLGHYITSASKSMAPGLRIGFLVVPPGSEANFALALRALSWMATPLTAEVVTRWIADGTAARLAEARRTESMARQRLAAEAFAGFDYRAAPCAFHGWLVLPAGWRAEAFVAAAQERGVLVTPAEAFSVSAGVPQAVRICLGGIASRELLVQGLAVLRALLDRPAASDAAERYAAVV